MVLYLTGYREGYPYPYPHTLYFLETANSRPYRFLPDQLRAKMILFAFGNALAQARLLYGVCMWAIPPYLTLLKERKRAVGIPCLTEEF